MVVWELSETPFPQFLLLGAHPTILDQEWSGWGRRRLPALSDVDFPEDAEFSSLYRLQGDDVSRLRAVFGPHLRAFLVAHPGISLAGKGGTLICYRLGQLPSGDGLDEFLSEMDLVRQACTASCCGG